MLLIVAIFIRGVQEVERNHSYETANFFAESELKDAADSALFEAAEKVRLNPEILPEAVNDTRQFKIFQQTKISERLGNITVEVYGERKKIEFFHREYSNQGKINDKKDFETDGIALISVASCENKVIGEKMYQSSFAYIDKDKPNIVQFANND